MKRRAAIFFVGTVLGLVLATLAGLQSGPFERYVRDRIEREVGAWLHAKVEIGWLQIQVISLKPGIQAGEIAVTPRMAAGRPQLEEPTVRVERMRIVFRPLQAMARRLDVDRIELEGPHLDLELVDGNLLGLPTPLVANEGPEPKGRTLEWRLDAILVKDGTFHLRADAPDLQLGLTRIRALGTFERNGSLVVDLESDGRRFRLGMEDGAFEESISALDARVVLGGSSLEIKHSRLVGGSIAAEAAGTIQLRGDTDVDLSTLRLVAPLQRLTSIAPSAPALDGTLNWDGRLTVIGKAVRARGHASVPDLWLDRFHFGDTEAEVDVTGSGARATALRVRRGGGEISGTAEVGFGSGAPELSLDTRLEQVSFAQLLDTMGIPGSHVDARVGGRLALKGPLRPLDLKVETELAHRDFVWRDRAWDAGGRARSNLRALPGRIGGRFTVRESGIDFTAVEAVAGRTHLATQGRLDFAGSTDLAIACAPLVLAEFSPAGSVALAGTGPATARIHGPFEKLVIEADLDLKGLRVEGFDFGDANGGLRFEDSVLASDGPTEIARGSSRYAGPWRIDFRDVALLSADVTVKEARIEDLADVVFGDPPASEHVRGSVSGMLSLRGPFAALDGDFRVAGGDLAVSGERFGSYKASGRWKKGTLWLDDLVAAKPSGAKVFARGSLGNPSPDEAALGGAVNLEIHTQGLTLSDVDHLGPEPLLTSEASLRMHLGGRLRRPEARGRLTLTHSRFHGVRLGASQIEFDTVALGNPSGGGSKEVLTVEANLVGGTLKAAGRVRLKVSEGFPYEIDLVATRHSFKPYLYVLNGRLARDEEVKASVSGTFRARGKLSDPRSAEIDVTANELVLARGPHRLQNDRPAVLSVGGGRIVIGDLAISGDETRFHLTGQRWADGRQEFRGGGKLDLALASLFTDAFSRLEGTLNVSTLWIGGSKGAPDVTAVGELEGGAVKLRNFPALPLEGIAGRIQVTENEVVIGPSLAGKASGGTFVADGSIGLIGAKVRNYEIGARVTDVSLRLPELGISARGSGEIEFAGPADRSKLSGTLRVADGKYTKPLEWKALALGQRRTSVSVSDPGDRLFDIDLVLIADDNLWVKNDAAHVEFHTRPDDPLRLVGSNADLRVAGTLESTRGKAVIQNTEFNVQTATVRFDDRHGFDFSLDCWAETIKRDWQITAHVQASLSGGLEPPQLESIPPLSDDDIHFLLATGLTHQETQGQDVKVAAGLIGSVVGQGLGERRGITDAVKRLANLDSVDVVPTYNQAGQVGLKTVIRKTINPDLTWTGAFGVTNATYNTQLDYRVNRRLHVVFGATNEDQTTESEAVIFGENDFGADAKFRFEWK